MIFSCAYIQLWHFFKFVPFIGRVFINRVSLVAHVVNNLPEIQETQVQSLSQEDPLKKGMATQYSILAWRMPWTEKPGELQSMWLHRVGHN